MTTLINRMTLVVAQHEEVNQKDATKMYLATICVKSTHESPSHKNLSRFFY